MDTTTPKDPIIFVHGAWHGKWCWEKFFRQPFEVAGHEVISFDLPGHGQPGKIKGINQYGIRDYTRALEQEVAKLDRPPILIAHSMGGLVAQKFLEKNSCKKVVLLAPVPPHGVIWTTLRFARKSYFYPSVLGMNLYKLVDTAAKSRAAFFSEDMPQEEVKTYADQMCSESFKAFIGMLFPFIKVNYHRQVPMLVLGAELDTIFTPKDNQKTAQKYGADLHTFPQMAHDMMLEKDHALVASHILQWLETS
ncbi:MAG: alpha/beta hydrolase [Bacteroidota bacterium]